MRHWLALLGLCLALALASVPAGAADGCRVALDFGSSGIRAGTDDHKALIRHEANFLALLAGDAGLSAVMPAITEALAAIDRHLSTAHCDRLAGGFSVWRRAAERDPRQLAATLRRLHDDLQLPLLVIPQDREGHYGHVATRQQLGTLAADERVFDLGGGSFQITDGKQVYGRPLGQKTWQATLCQALRGQSDCQLPPWSADEVTQARAIAGERLADLVERFPPPFRLIAVSRPVTAGVAPAVHRLATVQAPETIDLPALRYAMLRLTGQDMAQTISLTGIPAPYAGYLLSDMLLLEALIEASGTGAIRVAEIELSNVPGLLADRRAWQWRNRFACYLERLEAQGEAAWFTDPASCPASAGGAVMKAQ